MKNYLIIFFILLFSNSNFAQSSSDEEIKRGVLFGIYATATSPRGQFGENLEIVRPISFSTDLLIQSKRDPWLFWGMDFSFFYLDVESDFFGDYNLTSANYAANSHFQVHVEYGWNSFIKTYAEGLLGGQYFFTRTIREDFTEDLLFRAAEIDKSDWGASFGGTIGVQLRLSKGIFIITDLTYLKGSSTEYLVRSDEQRFGFDPLDAFDAVTSPTDLLMLKVGLQFGREGRSRKGK